MDNKGERNNEFQRSVTSLLVHAWTFVDVQLTLSEAAFTVGDMDGVTWHAIPTSVGTNLSKFLAFLI
jgi:hypothetical protein